MTTIRDVAARAGVAVTTVSRVLNESGPVSARARLRVEEAVRSLGYLPNDVARGLVTGVTRTIALILPDITNPFFPTMARGAEDAARERGYTVVLGNSDNDPAREAEYIRLFRQRRVDGLAIASSRAVSALPEAVGDVPVVLIDRLLDGWNVDSVVTDNALGAELAVEHLASLGHRRLAHLGGPAGLASADERLRGFRAACERLGAEIEDISRGPFTSESGYERGLRLLGGRSGELGVTAANDMIACGFLQAAADAGFRVPGDVSVVGFDDIPLARLLSPPLTTILQPAYAAGRTAIERLAGRLERPDQPIERITLKPRLVVRRSTRRRA